MTFLGGKLKISVLFIPIILIMIRLTGAAEVAAFAVAIVLHECAHALAARAAGLRVESMELMPFGCTARIIGMGESVPAASEAASRCTSRTI